MANADLDQIRALAYQLWEEEGRPEGRAQANWIEAEKRAGLLNAFQGAVGATAEAKVQAPERGFDGEGYVQQNAAPDTPRAGSQAERGRGDSASTRRGK